jgi:hypothetical protein
LILAQRATFSSKVMVNFFMIWALCNLALLSIKEEGCRIGAGGSSPFSGG